MKAESDLNKLINIISTLINKNEELEESLRKAREDNQIARRALHCECLYGDEEDLTAEWFETNSQIIQNYAERNGNDASREARTICDNFRDEQITTFDGPITIGDMIFLSIFIERIKPKAIYEIGVASGYSSAFILTLGSSLGLIPKNEIFLHSHDLLHQHSVEDDGKENMIGEIVHQYFPELSHNWNLKTNSTSFDLQVESESEGKNLFFIDGGHEHPWPLIDIINIFEQVKDKDTWILLQDNRVIERWYQDSNKYNVKMLTPVRGVEIPFMFWPGKKVSGKDGCYNMCAIHMDISDSMFSTFVQNTTNYWPYLKAENNYGNPKFREELKRKLGDYEEVINNKLKKYL